VEVIEGIRDGGEFTKEEREIVEGMEKELKKQVEDIGRDKERIILRLLRQSGYSGLKDLFYRTFINKNRDLFNKVSQDKRLADMQVWQWSVFADVLRDVLRIDRMLMSMRNI
jgi:hypothetical protein